MNKKILLSLFFLIGVGALTSCTFTFPWERTADLQAVVSDVNHYASRDSKSYPVGVGQHSKLIKGDGVNVDQKGSAILEMGGCDLRIYRSSGLQVTGLPSSSAPVCTVYFQQGTIYNRVKKKMIINTDWVVIETVGTEFIVHLDPDREIVWILVVEDDVAVTAVGETVLVSGGEQTWVWRGQPPEQPRPANREEIADLFPPLEDLTNGELSDDRFIVPTGEDFPPAVTINIEPSLVIVEEEFLIQALAEDDKGIVQTMILIDDEVVADCPEAFCEYQGAYFEFEQHEVEAVAIDTAGQRTSEFASLNTFRREDTEIVIETSTDEIILGECPGPKSLEITARMPLALIADRAILQYQWDGIEAQFLEMEKIDDATFVTGIESFDYCCEKVFIELLVEAYGFEGELITTGRRDVLMTYCIG